MINENDAILPPSEMKFLAKRKSAMELKKMDDSYYSEFDTKKAAGVFVSGKGRKPKTVVNTVLDKMKGVYEDSPLEVLAIDDILTGVSMMDNGTTPLSKRNLVDILSHVEVVSVHSVSNLIGTSERQSRKYMKACEIAIPFLERANFKIRTP